MFASPFPFDNLLLGIDGTVSVTGKEEDGATIDTSFARKTGLPASVVASGPKPAAVWDALLGGGSVATVAGSGGILGMTATLHSSSPSKSGGGGGGGSLLLFPPVDNELGAAAPSSPDLFDSSDPGSSSGSGADHSFLYMSSDLISCPGASFGADVTARPPPPFANFDLSTAPVPSPETSQNDEQSWDHGDHEAAGADDTPAKECAQEPDGHASENEGNDDDDRALAKKLAVPSRPLSTRPRKRSRAAAAAAAAAALSDDSGDDPSPVRAAAAKAAAAAAAKAVAAAAANATVVPATPVSTSSAPAASDSSPSNSSGGTKRKAMSTRRAAAAARGSAGARRRSSASSTDNSPCSSGTDFGFDDEEEEEGDEEFDDDEDDDFGDDSLYSSSGAAAAAAAAAASGATKKSGTGATSAKGKTPGRRGRQRRGPAVPSGPLTPSCVLKRFPTVAERPVDAADRRSPHNADPAVAAVALCRSHLLSITSEEMEVFADTMRAERSCSAAEVKELRRQRRLVKNRLYAQESRNKKKEMAARSNQRVDKLIAENRELKARVKQLEERNRILEAEKAAAAPSASWSNLLQVGGGSGNRRAGTSSSKSAVLMVALLSIAVAFFPSWSPVALSPVANAGPLLEHGPKPLSAYFPEPVGASELARAAGPGAAMCPRVPTAPAANSRLSLPSFMKSMRRQASGPARRRSPAQSVLPFSTGRALLQAIVDGEDVPQPVSAVVDDLFLAPNVTDEQLDHMVRGPLHHPIIITGDE